MVLRAGTHKFFSVGVGIAEMAAPTFTGVIGYFFSPVGRRLRSLNYLCMPASLPIVGEWFAIAPGIARNIGASDHAAFDRRSRHGRVRCGAREEAGGRGGEGALRRSC
jgi:hypothetical protein